MTPRNRKAAQLPIVNPASNLKIRFSFGVYDSTSTKFCLSLGSPAQIRACLARLKEINENTFTDLVRKRTVYHFHEVDWANTTEKSGFPDKRLAALEPYQIALLGVNQQLARMYGAFSQDTFYIVWFDWNHQITPTRLRHT